MIEVAAVAISVLLALAAVASVAVGAALARRWELSRRLARAAVLSAIALLPVGTIVLVAAFGRVANADASSKATALARGISEAMNCAALFVLVILMAAPAWLVASRRLRSTTPGPAAPSRGAD